MKMGRASTATAGERAIPRESLGKRLKKHWEFYLLLLPGIVITII